jgi:hypothetical protein
VIICITFGKYVQSCCRPTAASCQYPVKHQSLSVLGEQHQSLSVLGEHQSLSVLGEHQSLAVLGEQLIQVQTSKLLSRHRLYSSHQGFVINLCDSSTTAGAIAMSAMAVVPRIANIAQPIKATEQAEHPSTNASLSHTNNTSSINASRMHDALSQLMCQFQAIKPEAAGDWPPVRLSHSSLHHHHHK